MEGEGDGPRALAACQTVPRRGDVSANLAQHVELARLAAEAGARAIVFPELSLTGYELELAEELAFDPEEPRLNPLRRLATDRGVLLVVGAPVRLNARLLIGAFALGPDGSVRLHTKSRLGAFPASIHPDGPVPPPEPSVFVPGDRQPLIELPGERPGARAAIGICAEVGDESHPRAAQARGATCYLASLFVTPTEIDDEHAQLAGYAARHRLAIAMADFGGPTGGLPAGGGSALWSDLGELLVRLPERGAAVAVALEDGPGRWSARAVEP